MAKLEQLHCEIIKKLELEFGFKQNTAGDYLTEGKCPECGKKQLFTAYKKPYYITCNRRNKCAYEITVKQLMPELFENI
jgi:ssDNA-binding Zn-finger/Zn-ribbon topoisomerase 1